MERHAEESLAHAKQQTPQLADVKIRLPELLFNDAMTLRIGGQDDRPPVLRPATAAT